MPNLEDLDFSSLGKTGPDLGSLDFSSLVAIQSPVQEKDRTSPEMNIAHGEQPVTELGLSGLVNLGMEKVGRAVVGTANLVPKGMSYLLGRGGKVNEARMLHYGEPVVNLMQPLTPEEEQQVPAPAAGIYRSAANAVNSFTTPEMIAMLPLMPLKAVQVAFATQMGLNVPGQVQQAYKTIQDPNAPPVEKWAAGTEPIITGGMAGLAAHGAMKEAPPTVVPLEVMPPQSRLVPNPAVRGGFVPQAKGLGLRNAFENLRNIVQVESSADVDQPTIEQPTQLPPSPLVEVQHKVQQQQEQQPLTEDQIPPSVLEELRTRATKVQSNIEQSLSGLKELSGNIRRATTGQEPKEPSVAEAGIVKPTETPPIQKVREPSVTGGVSGTVYGLTPEEIRAEHQELADMTGEELGPVPEPKAEGPGAVLNEFKAKEMDGTQIVNRLRNKLHPDEWQVYKDLGVEQFAGKKVDPKVVSQWMEENGPKVEVRKAFSGEPLPENQARLAQVEHQLDTIQPDWRHISFQMLLDKPETSDLAREQHELSLSGIRAAEGKIATWSSIAPKSERDMPGYTEGAVVLPTKTAKESGLGYSSSTDIDPSSVRFPSTHSFPPNTLAFWRGYMETTKEGKKVFHVIEVQSDWAQKAREDVERERDIQSRGASPQSVEAERAFSQKRQHPLLRQYERLALKSAIEHARKEGADAIAISDAETAMMTEGHDRLNETAGYSKIPQEPGMRLHYDQTLPRILEELTGKKGERVEFGEHKMAFRDDYIPTRSDELGRLPRKDLIFREPTGEPKTSVSARVFPLDKTREQFSLFSKDRPLPSPAAEPVGREALPEGDKQAYDRLALGSKITTVHDALSHMADEPGMFGTEYSAMAGFLADHYEHVLRLATFDEGAGRLIDRSNYDPYPHKVYLNLTEEMGNSLPFKVLHEAAHAATLWQIKHPRTDIQIRASETIKTIMQLAKQRLPEEVRKLIGTAENGVAYYFKSPQEFVAGIFSSPELRRLLNGFSYQAKTGWKGIVDAVKQILGVKPKSALDTAFDQLIEVGQERGGINKARSDYGLDPVGAPSTTRAAAVISDVTASEKWDAFLNKRKGYSAPAHAAADINVANKLIRYTSARTAAPLVGESMATDVLGKKWKDGNFAKLLGGVMVEDRIRAVRSAFQDLANKATDPAEKALLQRKANSVTTLVKQPYSGIRDEAQFQALLKNKDIVEAIQRHKNTVQPYVEQKHVALGGEKARLGENTDAFVNLRAILAPDDVESLRSMIFGSKKGDLTNPLKRGSSFSKQTSGTAWMYETDYRKLVERMVRGNYEKYALDQYYKAMADAGLGYEAAPGGGAPKTAKGKTLEKVEVVRKGTGPGMTMVRNFWVRPDLASELHMALSTDKAPPRGAVGLLLDTATDLQVMGPTDLAWHGANMLGVVAGSQGSKTWFRDMVRKGTPLGIVDGLTRLSYNFIETLRNSPDTQKLMAQLSEAGAGRDVLHRQGGLLSKAVTGVTGLPIELTKKFDPAAWVNEGTSWLLKNMDKAGRLTLTKMYDNLVQRGMVTKTEAGRREFINRMGQYNSRLMPYFAEKARSYGLSSFVVAGLNMNRQAFRRLLMSPGVRDASPQAHAAMVATEAVGFLSIMYAFPILANLAITGKPWGRPGTQPGAIDTGKTDEKGRPVVFDPLQLLLLRRARRNIGLDALAKGRDQNWSGEKTRKEMGKDIFNGLVRPWNGPAPRLMYTGISGRELSMPANEGYLLSRNPNDNAENIVAALRNANPTLAEVFKGQEEGTGGVTTPFKNLLGAIGIKHGRSPTFEERSTELIPKMFPGKTAIEELNPGERRRLEKQLGLGKQPANDLAARQGAERNLWETFAREDALKSSLPQEHQDWLKAQGLKLPGFETELTMGKVRIPGTRQEQETMAENISSEYQKVISRMMATGQDVTQERLNRALDMARKRARGMFKRGMGVGPQ